MPVIERSIQQALPELAELAASGNEAAFLDALDDLTTTVKALFETQAAQARWPKGTPGGLGGQFMPKDGKASGGGSDSRQKPPGISADISNMSFDQLADQLDKGLYGSDDTAQPSAATQKTFKQNVKGLASDIMAAAGNVLGTIRDFVTDKIEAISNSDTFKELGELFDDLQSQGEEAVEAIDSWASNMKDQMGEMLSRSEAAADKLPDSLEVSDELGFLLEVEQSTVKDAFKRWVKSKQAMMAGVLTMGALLTPENLEENAKSNTILYAGLSKSLANEVGKVKEEVTALKGKADGMASAAGNAVGNTAASIRGWASGMAGAAADLKQQFTDMVDRNRGDLVEAGRINLDSIHSQIDKIINQANDIGSSASTDTEAAAEKARTLASTAKSYAATAKKQASTAATKATNSLQGAKGEMDAIHAMSKRLPRSDIESILRAQDSIRQSLKKSDLASGNTAAVARKAGAEAVASAYLGKGAVEASMATMASAAAQQQKQMSANVSKMIDAKIAEMKQHSLAATPEMKAAMTQLRKLKSSFRSEISNANVAEMTNEDMAKMYQELAESVANPL